MGSERDSATISAVGPPNKRLSYKFQRLRERIRAAIDSGELAGKLPGERTLARQFNVNAKTLSKALTDLAAEGVLQRNIGLGTFVRGADHQAPTVHVLLLTPADTGDGLATALTARSLTTTAHAPDADLPPSLLARYDVVLIDSPAVADETVRGLLVRGKDVITIDRISQPYSAHALLPHAARGAARAAEQLAASGHRRILLLSDRADVLRGVRQAVPEAEFRPAEAADVAAGVQDGFTGAVCDAAAAGALRAACRSAGIDVPQAFSVVAFGRVRDEPDVDGCFVTDAMLADAVAEMLAAGLPHQPLTLWLAGRRGASGTVAAADVSALVGQSVG